MRLIVVESPCAGDFMKNRAYALWACLDCYKRDEAAFASHLLYTQFLDDTDPVERSFGIDAGLEWATYADAAAFYTDRGMSPGMQKAMAHWQSKEMPIEFRKLPAGMLDAWARGETPASTSGF